MKNTKEDTRLIKELLSLGWRTRSIEGSEYIMEISMINRHYTQGFNLGWSIPKKKEDIKEFAKYVTNEAISDLAIETFKTK